MFLLDIVDKFFLLYTIMLLLRILGTWVPEWRDSRVMLFLAFCTDPYLNLFRRIIPPLGMVDLSPIVAFLCLGFIKGITLHIVALSLGYA